MSGKVTRRKYNCQTCVAVARTWHITCAEATVNQALDVGGEVEVVDEQRQDRRDT